jgi:hypothetical protein
MTRLIVAFRNCYEWFQTLALSVAVHIAQQKPATVTTEISCVGPGSGGKVGQINSTLHRSVDEMDAEVGIGTLYITINIRAAT